MPFSLSCGRILAAAIVAAALVAGGSDITQGTIRPISIAIPPFVGASGADDELGRNVAQVIAADLRCSGRFAPVDPSAFIEPIVPPTVTPNLSNWRPLNAQALVSGAVSTTGNDIIAEYRLWDLVSGEEVIGKISIDKHDGWRRLAHIIADSIYERLTGEKGYFDSRIAFVDETGSKAQRVKPPVPAPCPEHTPELDPDPAEAAAPPEPAPADVIPPASRVMIEPVLPRPRPNPPKQVAQPKPAPDRPEVAGTEKKPPEFNINDITALLDKQKPAGGGAPAPAQVPQVPSCSISAVQTFLNEEYHNIQVDLFKIETQYPNTEISLLRAGSLGQYGNQLLCGAEITQNFRGDKDSKEYHHSVKEYIEYLILPWNNGGYRITLQHQEVLYHEIFDSSGKMVFPSDERQSEAQSELPTPQVEAPQAEIESSTPEITQYEIETLKARLRQCWNPPVAVREAGTLVVQMRITLLPDGSLSGQPVITGVAHASDPLAQVAAEAAIRAVVECAPFGDILRPENYALWNQIDFVFDPREIIQGVSD